MRINYEREKKERKKERKKESKERKKERKNMFAGGWWVGLININTRVTLITPDVFLLIFKMT